MEELRKIRAALAGGVTKTQLAERAGVARGTLDSFDRDGFNPRLHTLVKLARAAEDLSRERLASLNSAANG